MRYRYFALLGGLRGGLNDSANTFGDVRLEVGGRYVAFQLGAAFGEKRTAVRGELLAHIFLKPWKAHAFFVVPRLGLGYGFVWRDDPNNTRFQNFFVNPSLRLRYDFKNRVSVFLDPLAVGVTFLQLTSSDEMSLQRVSTVNVHLGAHAGVALLY